MRINYLVIEISCHALILALSVSWRRLDIPGVERLTGAGVYYGAAQTEALSLTLYQNLEIQVFVFIYQLTKIIKLDVKDNIEL